MENYELKGLESILVSRLLIHMGPLAHMVVRDVIKPLEEKGTEKLSSIHIVSVLRQLHGLLPTAINRDEVIDELRNELLANNI